MAKTLQQEAFDTLHAQEMEIATRELQRRSMDTIRIYNPLDHTFVYMHDRFWHKVPAKGTKDVRRYLAIHFFKKICDEMIGAQITKQGQELKDLREKQMGKQFLDKYEENVQIWDRMPTMNDQALIEQIKNVVILGLVEEYGTDEPEKEEREPDRMLDMRPLHEQIMGDIDKIALKDEPLPPIKPPLYKSRADQAKELTNED